MAQRKTEEQMMLLELPVLAPEDDATAPATASDLAPVLPEAAGTPLGSLAALFLVVPDVVEGIRLVDPRAIAVDRVNARHGMAFDANAQGELIESMRVAGNTVPVRLAKEKLGTKRIAEMAKEMGVETPLRTDKTMPLGTSELTVLDQATAYGVFPADGMQSRRHGISQILNYDGKILYDFGRDTPPARRVLSEEANSSMNRIFVTIPVNGTARRGALDRGIVSGGKTGTTQAYRDAWYVGFTGNYTAAVWFGNDDYTSTNNMTGGSLPAMTFKRLMDYAHQGIELRPIPGIENPLPDGKKATETAKAPSDDNPLPALVRPRSLSSEVTRLLKDIARQLGEATPLKADGRVAALDGASVKRTE